MAGKIIADTIESAGSQISLNVGNVTVLTASITGLTLIPTTNVNINLTNSIVNLTSGNVTNPSLTFSGNTSTGIFMPAANTIAFTTAGTEDMRIDSSGRVGIGTNSPSYVLDVQGTTATQRIASTTGTNAAYQLFSNTGQNFYVGLDNSAGNQLLSAGYGATLLGSGAYPMVFGTNNTERMRILSTGELVVGTTAIVGAEQLGIVFSDPSGKNGLGIQVVSNASNAGFAVFRNSSGTLIGSITRNTTTNAVLYNTSSDYRLKENITPLTNALARVSALKPVQWLWKDCDGVVGEGFIAHEVQDVVPAAVSGEKDAVDGEGNIKPQGMDASYLVATLTAAIQELKVIVDAQAVEIAALKAK